MSANRLARIMFYQLKAANEADHPNIMVYVDESDVKCWFFLVTNLPGPYAGGEYIFRLTAPATFPLKPPEFEFLTPNGVFELGGKICISIGEFHANDAAGKTGAYGWRPALGMIGFAREVVNGMLVPDNLGDGIRIRNDPPATKAGHAAASEAYNRQHLAELVGHFQAFEAAHPDHKVVRFRRMWRAAAAASAADFASAMLSSLPPVFADAFGETGWAILAESLGYAAQIPDIPADQPAPKGFRVNGRAVILRVADRIREALVEREPPVRLALIRALNARILWEIASAPGPGRAPWIDKFRAAYKDFLESLPGVCGGACQESVPGAMAKVGASPAALPKLHADLARFLRSQDIDYKARLGEFFAARALAEAAEAPVEEEKEAPQPSEAAGVVFVATPAIGDPAPAANDLDGYVAELLDDL